MKLKLLFLTLCLVGCVFPTILKGEGGSYPPQPREPLFVMQPIQLVIQDESIDIFFNTDFEWVEIILQSNTGKMSISQYVDTSVQSKATLDITQLPAGSYTLMVIDANGQSLAEELLLIP